MATADYDCMDTTDDVLSEELVALEAIYIKELTVEYDEKDHPQSIAVMLHPATGMDESKQYVCMTLCFTFPPNYPDVIPDIMVKNPRGLGEENLQSLIEDMLKKAEERKGGQMLYELIEMAKDCLTEGNLPRCECAICLDHFEEGDNFFKTDCYHYYHWVCLARCLAAHKASLQEEEAQGAVLHHHHHHGEQNVFRCPMCRVPLNFDLDDLQTEVPEEEEKKEEVVALSQEVIQQQQERAALYERQKAKGGIIDLEHEKNKFFVDENTVFQVSRPEVSSTNEPPSEKRQPEPDDQQTEREPPPAPTRKAEGATPSHRPLNQSHAGGRPRRNHQLEYADISQGYSDYEDDAQAEVEDRYSRSSGGGGFRSDRGGARGSGGRGIRSDRGSERGSGRRDRGRGRGQKPRDALLSADPACRSNPSRRSDSDFVNGGQGCGEFVSCSTQSVDDVRNDRTAARSGSNGNYRGGHRGRGGRDHNRTYRRDEHEELTDPSGANFRRDRANRKPDFKDCAETLREREKYNRDKRDSSRNREAERGEGHSRLEKEIEGNGRTDGAKNFRDGERDAAVRDGHAKNDNRRDGWHNRTSPRDRGHPRNDDARGQYGENARNRQERSNTYQGGRRGGRHQPQEDAERGGGYKDPRPRGYHREKGDRDSPRDVENPTHSPRERESYSGHPDNFPDNRFGSQRSDDSRRHHAYQRKNENSQGSGKDGAGLANNEDGPEGGGGPKNRRHIADRQHSQQTTDDGEAAQENGWTKPRARGDRTFVRGQGSRGRPGGRGQNRTPGTQWDTAQGPGRQPKPQDRGHNHFAGRRPQHSAQHRAGKDWGIDDDDDDKEEDAVPSPAELSSRKTGRSVTDDGVSGDSRGDRTSHRDDGGPAREFHKPHGGGQRSGQRDGSGRGGRSSQRHPGRGRDDGLCGQSHAPPPGFPGPRPPPGFTGKNPWGVNHPLQGAEDPPRPPSPAKVSPPPGFS